MKILYTDIDYVLSLASDPNPKMTKWGWVSPCNKKAVAVYNHILLHTGAAIVVSSDWRHHYTLEQLKDIFINWIGACRPPIGVTGYVPGTIQKLEECRAKEILEHVEKFKPEAWVAIDDLDLSPWIDANHFVYLPRMNEGIKQSGKAQKIIELLNTKNKL